MRGKAAGAAGAFGSGLFRGREATAPPVKITGGAAPSPPLALPLVFLLSLSSTSGLVGHLPHLSARLPGWDAKKPGVSAARRASSFCVEPKASKQPPPAIEGAGREVIHLKKWYYFPCPAFFVHWHTVLSNVI